MTDERQIRADLSQCLGRLWRFGVVLSLQCDVADDLVEATCVRALERAPLFIGGNRLDCWLFSILHSIWHTEISPYRFRMGQATINARQTKSSIRDENIEIHVMDNPVLRQVTTLPEEYRATVFLAYVEDMSYREVADVLAVPIGTVTSCLACARIMLAENAEVSKAPGLV
ncbi:RNA polymerase sigma factor [Phyllobacterium sp. LjRoot231]|uniref:sigma factor-like helix-turn-helix DNA-binding protein n=1 Tax=Phyllobacterium sp. LjRoot231 TaxID=3342289 RepID=UPI003ECD3A9C